MATSAAPSPIDINTWTEQTLSSLSTLAISAATTTPDRSIPRGTSVTLDIPLDIPLDLDSAKPDDVQEPNADPSLTHGAAQRAEYVRRREPLRRDSLKRREALLKGKEGSRRRQKWENGACPLRYTSSIAL